MPQDYVQAYAWFSIAAEKGNQEAIKNRINVANRMTPSQLEAGQELSKELKEKYGKK